MAPNFALSLSFEGIALLRRAGNGWFPLGEVALDRDDLDAALRALRDEAETAAPDGAKVILVLPNEQIRYLDLPDPGGDDAARGAAVRAAFDGATPYAVDELVIDWSRRGDTLLAAAVARETLEEADGFIRAHGFDPVSFTAMPEAGSFEGPAFFGAAPGWTGTPPERLSQPVRIVAAPEPEPEPTPEPEPEAPAEETAPDIPAAALAPLPEPAPAKAKEPPAPAAEPEIAGSETTPPTPPKAEAEKAASAEMPAPTEEAPNADANAATEAPRPASFGQGIFGPGGNARADTIPALENEAPKLRAAPALGNTPPLPGAGDAASGPAPSFTSIRATRDLPPAAPAPSVQPAAEPGPGAANGKAKLRAREADGAAPVPPAPVPPTAVPAKEKDGLGKRARAALAGPARNKAKPAEAKQPPAPKKPPRKAAKAAPAPAAPPAPGPAAKSTPPAPRPDAVQTAALRRSRNDDPGPAAPAIAAAATFDPEEERRRMTVFGARNGEQIGGKPRYLGLMLTAVLLLFLAGVAAWASVFLDEGLSRFFGGADVTETAAVAPEEPKPDAETTALPEPETEAEDDTALTALEPAPTAPPPPAPAPIQPEGAQAPTPEEAEARYAATGIWQRAPTAPLEPAPDQVEDLYVASVDPKVGQFDAVALPEAPAAGDDLPLDPQRLPPGPDVRFDLDDQGLVRATPEGAISPDGVRVFAGQPPQVPPARSATETPGEPAAEAAPQEAADPAVEQLQERRPQARPGDLVEQAERANLGGISIAELSRIRPALRPLSAQEEASAQADAQQAEDTADQAEDNAEPDTPPATELAIANSLAPQPRPGDMAGIVRRAERETVQTASTAPVRMQPGPRVPQNTNVAKEATVRNQINLRQMNLIGVFGKASSRRALVRLSNGRLQNVKVGDRLDGGRVAAIGESELQLTKSGRNIVLRMPSG
ncbi:hypothetical protein [Salipiger abyssi]|uniref:hypothetical protein n=1 Tax=Salipiger abyssi TaxID=1250539 RepID=UPI001A8E3D41|nr:hypothetical protein [Salipiger abyssi]MBN9888497.1 hypothetical protein [Salipiger abyssi]